MSASPIYIATRGSALALVQANMVLAQCQRAFPDQTFAIKVFKTTGDKLQGASLSNQQLPKGLFTKELEAALLGGEADLAVHSLKDLPTELPEGLTLGAVSERADARDVLIYRDAEFLQPDVAGGASAAPSPTKRGFQPQLRIGGLPHGAAVASSSPRRAAQLREQRPDLKVIPIRGNVGTRLKKLAEQPEIDAIVLAAAGLARLGFSLGPRGELEGAEVPAGLLVRPLEPEEMLPCVGQGALGIEVRIEDDRIEAVCANLNHYFTRQCVTAERAFLKAMGGGCQMAVAAYAEVSGDQIRLRAVSFLQEKAQRGEARRPLVEAASLGESLAAALGRRAT